ncbi:hypothetical protein [Staphylococcus capitis]|nr:hypothetical protein [Staphylococcus capitis]
MKEVGGMSVGEVLNEEDIDREKEVVVWDRDKGEGRGIYSL